MLCHCEHKKRPPHLDKNGREALRQLPPNEWASLAVTVLADRIETLIGPSYEATVLLEQFAGKVGYDLDALLMNFKLRRNARCAVLGLRNMSFRMVAANLGRSAIQQGFNVDDVLNRMASFVSARLIAQLPP